MWSALLTAGRKHAAFSLLCFSKLKEKRKLHVVSAILDIQATCFRNPSLRGGKCKVFPTFVW